MMADPSAAEPVMAEDNQKTIIAHRGASGYLPEHTLQAAAMAYGQGAHYIEQDVVITKDGVVIVLHDIALGAVTDVEQQFPGRAREDGRYYVIDFTLDEIRRLDVHERIRPDTGKPAFPSRFPQGASGFKVSTLAEHLELIRGLNASTGRNVGVFTEIKRPAFHRKEGQDSARLVIETLAAHGYRTKDDPAFILCFDWNETQRMRKELGYKGRLVQLMGKNDWKEAPDVDYDALWSESGMRKIAQVADAVGPWVGQLVTGAGKDGAPEIAPLAARAQAAGLKVYPYTLRADLLPPYAPDFDRLLEIFLFEIGADGIFTDQPDKALAYLAKR